MNKKLKQDINFFDYIGKEKAVGAIDFMAAVKKSLLIFVVVTAVVIGGLLSVKMVSKSRINGLNAKIEAMQEQLNEIAVLKETSEGLQRDIDKFNSSVAEFKVTPRLTIENIEKIAKAKPTGVVITSFSYSKNTVSITCSGGNEMLTADYAYQLRNSQYKNPNAVQDGIMYIKDFKDVTYTGATGAGGQYTSTIIIELNDIVSEEETEVTTEAGGDVSE